MTDLVEQHCNKHGKYMAKTVPGFGGRMIVKEGCPKCLEEREARSAEYEEMAAEREREDQIRRCVHNFDKDTPLRFKNKNFENYIGDNKGQEYALRNCRSYAENFESISNKGGGLVLCGSPGTGKTHLAISIGREAALLGKSARYIKLPNLIRKVRESWDRDSDLTEKYVIDCLTEHDLLIIDEIGVQAGTENERNIMFDVIDGRYEKMNSTIVLSNLNREEIGAMIGERCISRITEGGGVIVFNWEDYRQCA